MFIVVEVLTKKVICKRWRGSIAYLIDSSFIVTLSHVLKKSQKRNVTRFFFKSSEIFYQLCFISRIQVEGILTTSVLKINLFFPIFPSTPTNATWLQLPKCTVNVSQTLSLNTHTHTHPYIYRMIKMLTPSREYLYCINSVFTFTIPKYILGISHKWLKISMFLWRGCG